MRFDVLTLFPEIFPAYLGESILSRAIERSQVDVQLHNLRDWAKDKHQRVDDRPYGGGPGMVLMVEPVVDAVRAIQAQVPQPGRLVMLTPQGRTWNQRLAEEMAEEERLLLLCGRYEGFDHRVAQILQPEEISIGDFVLNGGEVAAMVMIETLVRLIPGVLGDEESNRDDSFSSGNRMLEYPQYTRPREFEGLAVPEILLSGNHGAIEAWRSKKSLENTRVRRSDLVDE